MTYDVKTTYPKSESGQDKITTISRNELLYDADTPTVLNHYNDLQRARYTINVSFETNEADIESPFDVGQALAEKGIDYQAKLKVKNQRTYADAKKLAQLVGAHGFDFTIRATLKIDENSAVDFDRPDTWSQDDPKEAKYKVNPKIKSGNVADLKDIFEALLDLGYETEIEVKPKKSAEDDFDVKLASYPDGTLIKFTCTESAE